MMLLSQSNQRFCVGAGQSGPLTYNLSDSSSPSQRLRLSSRVNAGHAQSAIFGPFKHSATFKSACHCARFASQPARRRTPRGAGLAANSTVSQPRQSEGGQSAQHVLILGGTGRVGSSTAASLLQHKKESIRISLSGRRQEGFDAAVANRPELQGVEFCRCDIDDAASLKQALQGVDLVVHTAGPFQRRTECDVLEACIEAGVPYMDVCDDADYSQRAKALHSQAQAAGVPCITTAGIYPGVSNVMAAHMIAVARQERKEDGSVQEAPFDEEALTQPARLRYSYFTAGSGGVGPTILETSMLLAGEEVVAYRDGQKVLMPPISGRRVVDFGLGLGRRTTYLYNLPEVDSAAKYMQVPAVSARFGTAPEIWNIAMWLTARLSPPNFLSDRNKSKWLASLAAPWVKFVDQFCGEKVAMLVEVEMENGTNAAGLFMHKLLSDSVGHSTAAFAIAMLDGETEPGVWFPEENGALKQRMKLLKYASMGCQRFILNKPVWALESNPKQLGFGMYY